MTLKANGKNLVLLVEDHQIEVQSRLSFSQTKRYIYIYIWEEISKRHNLYTTEVVSMKEARIEYIEAFKLYLPIALCIHLINVSFFGV